MLTCDLFAVANIFVFFLATDCGPVVLSDFDQHKFSSGQVERYVYNYKPNTENKSLILCKSYTAR